jgi:predicted HicB family RNase H-like nuclease
MVNINIEIPDDVHKKVKLAAVLADKTIKSYIIDALAENLKKRGDSR